MNHLDIMVPNQLGGLGRGEDCVINMASHTGVHNLSWGRDRVKQRRKGFDENVNNSPVVPFSSFICLA